MSHNEKTSGGDGASVRAATSFLENVDKLQEMLRRNPIIGVATNVRTIKPRQRVRCAVPRPATPMNYEQAFLKLKGLSKKGYYNGICVCDYCGDCRPAGHDQNDGGWQECHHCGAVVMCDTCVLGADVDAVVKSGGNPVDEDVVVWFYCDVCAATSVDMGADPGVEPGYQIYDLVRGGLSTLK